MIGEQYYILGQALYADKLHNWQYNGSQVTLESFAKLHHV
jgi:hypothetical protein